MKDNLRFIMLLALITFLCNGFVSATDTGTFLNDKIANETIKIQLSLVPVPSEKDQLTLADIKATLPPEILQSIKDQITFNESVTKAITEKEGQLAKSPLTINDSYDITGEVQGFFVANFTTSLEPTSKETGLTHTNISPSAIVLPENQIPTGGFIEFGSDGKTRIFSSVGTQISYVIDDRSEKITTPSGKVLPSTHIIGIPNGAASHTRGNREYITMNGEVILTIVDQYSKDISGLSTVPSPRSSPWVEYAESDPYYIAAVHSNWIIPHSPNLTVPATTSNILFNGIEPSDGSMVFQPVTAFNYYEHSLTKNRTDPAIVNRWTGSSWICPIDTSHCHRSNPVLSFSQGELAYGAVFWYEAPVSEWFVYLVNSNNQGTWQFSDPYIYFQPSRAVITYEFGGSDPSGLLPNDNQKITNTTFSNISVWDTIGNQITTLHWNGVINTKDHKKITGLNVDLSQAPSTVILETDYRGSGIGVFRSGEWILDYRIDGIVDRRFNYGLPTDKPVVGDFNNNGQTDIGVFRSGEWVLDYGMDGTVDRRFNYGLPTDTPLVGDFNNDGTTDIGVFRSGEWILDYGMDGTVNRRFNYGLATDIPVVGNFNNDGITDIGVFRSGQWILDYGIDGIVDRRLNYGRATDIPVVGKFNNDEITDIGVFRSGQWILDYGMDGIIDRYLNYGLATDIPLTGKWI